MWGIVTCVLVVTVLLAAPVEMRFFYVDYVLPPLLQEYPPLRDAFCKCPPELCVSVCPSLGVNGPLPSGGTYSAINIGREMRNMRCHTNHVNATEGSLQSVYRFCCRTAVKRSKLENLANNSANSPKAVTEKTKIKQFIEEEFQNYSEQTPLQEINKSIDSKNKSSAKDIEVEDVITDIVSDGVLEEPWSSTSTEPSSRPLETANSSDDAYAVDKDEDDVTDDSSSLADEARLAKSSAALEDHTLWSDVSTAGAPPHSEPTGNPPMLYVPPGDEQTVYVPMKDSPTKFNSSSETEIFKQARKGNKVSKRTVDSSSLNKSYPEKEFIGPESTPSTEAPPATPSSVQTVLKRVRRIYDGYNISYKNNPWMGVMLFTKGAGGRRSYCSGSLIASRYVVTAAHCFFLNGEKLNATKVFFGLTNIDIGGRNISGTLGIVASVDKEILHPGFTNIYKHDVALVKLNEAVYPNSIGVRALHLPPSTLHPRVLADIWVQTAGWGRTMKMHLSSLLNEVDLQIKENCCEHDHTAFDKNKQVCLVGTGDKSACFGDTGGAVTLRTTLGQVLVAVISRYGCGAGQSSTGTFVPPYVLWILTSIHRHGE